DMIDSIDRIATARPPKSARLYMTTSGSTGVPVGFYLHKGVSRPKERAFLEVQWRRAGYFDDARVVMIRAQVTSAVSSGSIAFYDAIRGWLLLSSYQLNSERFAEYLNRIRRFRPHVLHAYPGIALRLAELMLQTGEQWPVQLKCVLAGSERLTGSQQMLLEETFGCRVFSWYGHSERVVLAAQGVTSRSLYFWPAYGLVEFGPPDSQGLREVIGTSFHNLVMPLIRYRTGDYVRLHQDELDGQREFNWPAVTFIEGRGSEFLITATGRYIPVTPLMVHSDAHDDIYAIQLVQRKIGHLEFCYVPTLRFETARLARIEAILQGKVGDDVTISFREVADVERTSHGKGKWFVSTLESRPVVSVDESGDGETS
ncbi:MAG: hypothetical protein ACRDFS_00630, partial [Chloroflexota bacterium]